MAHGQKAMGEGGLDGGKLGRMGFRTGPSHQNRAIDGCGRENYYNFVQFGHDRQESVGYPGIVGSELLGQSLVIAQATGACW